MKLFHYQGCGLPNVYLVNGYKTARTAYGDVVSISDVEGLHGAIADQLVIKPSMLTPEEFRFLRTFLEVSQKKLGESLGTTDQTIANWEKGKSPVDRPAETLLRMLVGEHRGGNIVVRQFVERLNAHDHHERRKSLTFKQSRKTWRRDPKAA